MPTSIPITRALLSVSNKDGIVHFAKQLSQYGIEIISTGGTSKVISEAGIPVTSVDTLTGYPEMLDGRVKTLHPVIHGGLLGIRDEPSHVAAMEEHAIAPIDLICIDLYPFEETAEKYGVTSQEVIEQIDIGGPAMIRSASKNHAFVTVLTNPDQYEEVLTELENNEGCTTLNLRRQFARDAFVKTADYDAAISKWMDEELESTPTRLRISGTLQESLRYGENPDQKASVYRDEKHRGQSVVTGKVVAGKPLSYNNLMDAAAALKLVQDLQTATQGFVATIIKHANPCGAAVADSLSSAIDKAWECDPLAAFGGIVALSADIDEQVATTITTGEKFVEVVVAPSFSDAAIAVLSGRWKNVRLIAVGTQQREESCQQIKSIEGGILIQDGFQVIAEPDSWQHGAGPKPSLAQLRDATIAWIACGHLTSNAISIVENGVLIGGGMGQVDRVSAARLAIQRAGVALEKATAPVAGSDAFFPFADGPELLIDSGITCLVQPGGSVRDQDTIDLCNAKNVTLLHTGKRLFRH
ncbi:MAG: bifunctional phosphoribosylaminoimidazolecarboxamide formyltransferase/IMP cyclohydrolase [Planctomycetes bacterium]|nr:bifunctional phosphoribosylaminoimidazolecarboxamide formyltransferase/IMP cyclohydrolase [Planctomycetota bacterium]